ncbi:MAG TPA: hypothetical protein VFX51_16475, partial [Solirubrobacteraceae bacterium]|nr:hypothetical protein [Solirubrobacteraceae bacterium]
RAHALGDNLLIGSALAQVGLGTARAADAAPLVREAAARLREAGALEIASSVLTTAGMAALREDEYEVSTELEYEALEAALAAGDPYSLAFVHGNLALAALLGGRPQAARTAFRDELLTARAHGFATFYFEGLLGLAALAAADGDDQRAIVLDAAAWAHNERDVYPSEAPVYDRLEQRFIGPARERLGAEEAAAAVAAGRQLNAADALAYALAEPAVTDC